MISVVVPAFNEQTLIANCIWSIRTELFDTPHEIIVVDNGSTDLTAELAKQEGASVYFEPRKGVTRARQAGFKKAKYDTIAFIDADNELPEGWLECALNAVKPPQVVAASGPIIYSEFGLFKRLLGFAFFLVAKVTHLVFPFVQGGNFVIKRSALVQIGGFPEIDFWGEDTETGRRLAKVGVVKFDLNMWCYSSARRMQREGMIHTAAKYAINYLWVHLFGRPVSKTYNDIRN